MKYSIGERRVVTRGEYWIAPGAHVIGSVVLGHDVSIWFNSVVRGDNDLITIGDNSQVQDGCVLHTDPGFPMVLGKGVSIGHKSMIHGCTIGDGTLIGINSVILNGALIGKNCVIGANSLITERKVIPDGVMVMGSPGKVVRELRPEEIAFLHSTAEDYAERAKWYQRELHIDTTP
jgi:carbonic anhydrase/acetyltransferase-like protein (isoleucine patch superfamily)